MIISLILGGIIGWIAGKLMHSKGGILRNIVLGIIGSAVGSWLGGTIGLAATGTIGSILIFNPEVLIMDEPTGGLDEPGREMLSKTINMVHDAGHTVIIISHDMDYVAENS